MSQDLTALGWVKGAIEDNLLQARLILEEAAEAEPVQPLDITAVSLIQQVHGALLMLELDGASRLSQAMVTLATALSQQQLNEVQPAQEAMMRALLQLPSYLDQVQLHRHEAPLLLLPIINELHLALGLSAIAPSELFFPPVRFNPLFDNAKLKLIDETSLQAWLKKIRQMLQSATLQLLSKQQPQVATQYLAKLFARLHKSLGQSRHGTVWLAALAFCEWLSKQEQFSQAGIKLLRQLDQELKHLQKQGAAGLNSEPSLSLVRQLLFYVQQSPQRTGAIAQAKIRFELAPISLSAQELERQQAQFDGPDRHTIHHVLKVLIEEIAQLKDRLDLIIRNPDNRLAAVSELNLQVQQIVNTMRVLGLGMPLRVMQQQQQSLAAMIQSQAVTDPQLNDIAGSLLYIEASLSGMSKDGSLHSDATDTALTQAQLSVVNEARNTLDEVKAAIVAYLAQQWQITEIEAVPAWLHSIEGSLRMLPLEQCADLLQAAAQYVQQRLIEQAQRPALATLDSFADLLSSLDYYLERYSQNPKQADAKLLNRAATLIEQVQASQAAHHDEPTSALSADDTPTARYDDDIGIEEAEEILQQQQAMAASAPVVADDELIDDEIVDIFLEEAAEVLEEIHQHWPNFQQQHSEADLQVIRRGFHTLKGSGRMVNAAVIAELAWAIENMLNRLLEGSINTSPELLQLLEAVLQTLPELINDFKQHQPTSQDPQPLIAAAEALAAGQRPVLSTLTAPTLSQADPALLDIFTSEACQHLKVIAEFVQQAHQDNYQTNPHEDLQRAVHTLKGSAHMASVQCIAQLATALDKLLKEVRAYQLGNSVALTLLLERCQTHIESLLTGPVEALFSPCNEPAQELEQLINELYQANLEVAHNRGVVGTGPSPADIANFMAAGMDSLLDADELLNQWQRSGDNRILARLCSDLERVIQGASKAQLHHIQVFAEVLNEFYQRIETNQSSANTDTVALASRSHEALLNMFDALAADQEIARPEALLEELRQWHQHDVLDLLPNIEDFSQQTDNPSSTDNPDLTELFLEEADESLDNIDQLFALWQQEPDHISHTDQIQRELHTLKGGAQMTGFSFVAELCQELDEFYEYLSSGRLGHSPELVGLLERAHQCLHEQVAAIRQQTEATCTDDVRQALKDFTKQPANEPTHQPADLIEPEPAFNPDIEPEILEIFLEEASELEESLDTELNLWHQDPSNSTHQDEVLRLLHTLKGGARLAQASQIGDLTHELETKVLRVQQGQQPLDDYFFAELFSQQDSLHDLLEILHQQGQQTLTDPKPPAPAPELIADTDANLPADEPSLIERSGQELIRVPAELLENLVNLAGETAIGRGRVGQQVSDFGHTLEEMDTTLERLRDQLRRLDLETEAQVLFRQERQGPSYEDFDPLEMDRYSTIQQLSRALMESASDLIDLKNTLSNKTRDTETLLLQQSRINTELQEGLMQTRMVPFQRIVPRLRRIVRQTGQELDKQVELSVSNADGEMDRSILERLVPPLEHMLRNAIDHGIEEAQVRHQAGKPEQGQIQLSVHRDGGDIVLNLQDDGAGIALTKVRDKAVKLGLMQDHETLSDHEILQFITHPGFSTAEHITQISGRGVGMDVVAHEIKQMGGSIEIHSEVGQGTHFIIRLPFTVSVNRALMIRLGEEHYAVPLNNIAGIVRVGLNELRELYQKPLAQRHYQYAGTFYQVEHLHSILEDAPLPDLNSLQGPQALLLVRGATPFALQVDMLYGSREIVVKSLGPQFNSVMGISGGTILGDGSVVIILDLPALVRDYQNDSEGHLLSSASPMRLSTPAQQAKILVVDDSVTVRKVTSRLLERNGMQAYTAKDGIDALETLQELTPDLILLDIEMPRLDGFEVTAQIRHDSRLKHIPIIMITSRTGDKHRERALAMGVNQYLGKPFQEESLLRHIHQLLNSREAV